MVEGVRRIQLSPFLCALFFKLFYNPQNLTRWGLTSRWGGGWWITFDVLLFSINLQGYDIYMTIKYKHINLCHILFIHYVLLHVFLSHLALRWSKTFSPWSALKTVGSWGSQFCAYTKLKIYMKKHISWEKKQSAPCNSIPCPCISHETLLPTRLSETKK